MAEFSNDLETKIINHFFRNSSVSSPVTVYLALYTTDPTDADTGTEVSGFGYARQAITFGAPSGGVSTNTSGPHAFTPSGGGWGTIAHGAIRDALSGGNLMMHSPLDTARTINDGDTINFAVGAVSLTTQ